MSTPAWACNCGKRNSGDREECVDCGGAQPARAPRSRPPGKRCAIDNEPLDTRGFCTFGQGLPATMACPFVCPICRGELSWSGQCRRCFGCATSQREGWTIPGDRYELAQGHWRMMEQGPRPVVSPELSRAGLEIVGAVLTGQMSEADGHASLDDLARLEAIAKEIVAP